MVYCKPEIFKFLSSIAADQLLLVDETGLVTGKNQFSINYSGKVNLLLFVYFVLLFDAESPLLAEVEL